MAGWRLTLEHWRINPVIVEAHTGAVEAYQWTVKPHPGVVDLGAVEPKPGTCTVYAHGGEVKAYLEV